MIIRSTIKSMSYHLILSTLLFGMGIMLYSSNVFAAKPADKDYATKTELAAEESARIAADTVHTDDIGTNTANISTNTGNISTNTGAISTNTTGVSTNATGISTNAGNITALQSQWTTEGGTVSTTGSIQIDDEDVVCDNTIAGTIRWTGTRFEGCDGRTWRNFTPPHPTPGIAMQLEIEAQRVVSCFMLPTVD